MTNRRSDLLHRLILLSEQIVKQCTYVVAWLSCSVLSRSTYHSERTLRRAWLVLGWVTVCGRVNHLGTVCNQPPRSTQPSISPG